ncbi:MAG: C10 family peptidase [Treponema sp.]|jgi:hypothetical protein|nr:C10 family peptidase [Treponema sp.]
MKNKICFVAVLITVFFVACPFEHPETVTQTVQQSGRGEYLTLLKSTGQYKLSIEDLKQGAGKLISDNVSLGRSAVSSPMPVITGVNKLTIIGEKRFGSSGRSAADAGEMPIELYAFLTENPQGEPPGFVLACNDKRVGNYLAFVESGDLNDPDIPFLQILFGKLEEYIDQTIEEFNSITDDDVQRALTNARKAGRYVYTTTGNEADETGANALWNENGDLGTGLASSPMVEPQQRDYSNIAFADWYWTDGHYAYLPVEWHQNSPYNDVINSVLNESSDSPGNYLAGCGPVAAAQLMAYHQYPPSYTLPDLNESAPYNWPLITAARTLTGIPSPAYEEAVINAGMLLGEISVRQGAIYGEDITEVLPPGVINSLTQMGYVIEMPVSSVPPYGLSEYTGYQGYNFTKIRESIINQRPVLVGGIFIKTSFSYESPSTGGHIWVIDGVRHMTYTETTPAGHIIGFTYDWVHCNLGWGPGRVNGWYISGAFDTNSDSVSYARTVVNLDYYDSYIYNYHLVILPNVHPAGEN